MGKEKKRPKSRSGQASNAARVCYKLNGTRGVFVNRQGDSSSKAGFVPEQSPRTGLTENESDCEEIDHFCAY